MSPAFREEEARRDLGDTQVTPGTAMAMALGWGLLTLAIGMAEAARAWTFGDFSVSRANTLEQTGEVSRRLRPLQRILAFSTAMPTAGVVTGRDGWLYFERDLAHVAGPGFLEPAELHRRRMKSPRGHPDPTPAIVDFAAHLRQRKIRLIVLPAPTKPTLVPEGLVGAATLPEPPDNAALPLFLARLREAGVEMFDAVGCLKLAAGRQGFVPFLKTDTHWTPAGVDAVAAALARQIDPGIAETRLPANERWEPLLGRGDLARRLAPAGDGTETVLHPMPHTPRAASSEGTGTPSAPAQWLLLGDSFSNIHSDPALGFGRGAGLAERLARHAGRRVDAIAINDGGATVCRLEFARALLRQPGRFERLEVVVWEFAARELSDGDWPLVQLPELAAASHGQLPGAESAERVVGMAIRGLAAADSLRGDTPYPDALLAVRGEVRQPGGTAREVVVYVWGLRNHVVTSAIRWRVGKRVRLALTPWSHVEERLGRLARVELDEADDAWLDLPVYFGELVGEGSPETAPEIRSVKERP